MLEVVISPSAAKRIRRFGSHILTLGPRRQLVAGLALPGLTITPTDLQRTALFRAAHKQLTTLARHTYALAIGTEHIRAERNHFAAGLRRIFWIRR